MDSEGALKFVDSLLATQEKRLSDLERVIFQGSWEGKSYKEIHKQCANRSGLENLMKNAGPDLWKLLSEVLGEKVDKRNLQGPIERAWRSTTARSSAVSGGSEPNTLSSAPLLIDSSGMQEFPDATDASFWSRLQRRQAWITPNVSGFCGREKDLEQLEQRIRIDGCRLLTLFGVGGVGKTTLAVALGQRVWDQFEMRIWRSISSHPPLLSDLIADLTYFLSNQQEKSSDILCLLNYLVNHRCLIIFDGLEFVLHSGVHDGSYQKGYEEYGEFLKQLGRTNHQSCIVLTSREEPREVAIMTGGYICSYKVEGLGDIGGQNLMESQGVFLSSESDWRTLIRNYEGNPSVLNIVGTTIRHLFGGDISNFLEQFQQDTSILSDIRLLLDQQFFRLSELEHMVISCLIKQPNPVRFQDILQNVSQPTSIAELQEVLGSLRRRSLIEVKDAYYSLGKLIKRYAIDRMRE
jgi:hypothetical protein